MGRCARSALFHQRLTPDGKYGPQRLFFLSKRFCDIMTGGTDGVMLTAHVIADIETTGRQHDKERP